MIPEIKPGDLIEIIKIDIACFPLPMENRLLYVLNFIPFCAGFFPTCRIEYYDSNFMLQGINILHYKCAQQFELGNWKLHKQMSI